MHTKKITKTMSVCPHCDCVCSPVDHLFENKYGGDTSWYCDGCGGKYKIEYDSSKKCLISPLDEWKIDIAVVMKYQDIFVVVKGVAFAEGSRGNFDDSNFPYYYNEHTCPVNWMRVECLYDSKTENGDPHGLFEYVGYEVYPDGGQDCNFDWATLINRVNNNGD